MTGARRGVAFAVLSGALSTVACLAGDGGTRWGAGVVFGLLVLGPTAREASRFLALAVLSASVYRVAVWVAVRLAMDTPVPALAACAIAGTGGAVALSLGAGVVAGTGAARAATVRAALWGTAAGVAIGVAVEAPDQSLAQHLWLLAGFVAWQVGYTVSHRLAPWRRGSSA